MSESNDALTTSAPAGAESSAPADPSALPKTPFPFDVNKRRRCAANIWTVHFIRAFLEAAGIDVEGSGFKAGLELFNQKLPRVELTPDYRFVVTVMKTTGEVKRVVFRHPLVSIRRASLTTYFFGRESLIDPLVRGDWTPALDKTLSDAGLQLFNFSAEEVRTDADGDESETGIPPHTRDLLLTAACFGIAEATLIANSSSTSPLGLVRDHMTEKSLEDFGYRKGMPPMVVLPGFQAVVEWVRKSIEEAVLADIETYGPARSLRKDAAIERMTRFNPEGWYGQPMDFRRILRPFKPSGWRMPHPNTVRPIGSFGDMTATIHRQMSDEADEWLEWAAKGDAVGRDGLSASPPWHKNHVLPKAPKKYLRMAFRYAAPVITGEQVLVAQTSASAFSQLAAKNLREPESFSREDPKAKGRTGTKTAKTVRTAKLKDALGELITMPAWAARVCAPTVVAWRAVGRLAALMMQTGAVMPVPYVEQEYPFVAWVPRADVSDRKTLQRPLVDLARWIRSVEAQLVKEAAGAPRMSPPLTDAPHYVLALLLTYAVTALMRRATEGRTFLGAGALGVIADIPALEPVTGWMGACLENAMLLPLCLVRLKGRPVVTVTRPEPSLGRTGCVLSMGIRRFGEKDVTPYADCTGEERRILDEFAVQVDVIDGAHVVVRFSDAEPGEMGRVADRTAGTFITQVLPKMGDMGLTVEFEEGSIDFTAPEVFLTMGVENGEGSEGTGDSEELAFRSGRTKGRRLSNVLRAPETLLNAASLGQFNWKMALWDRELTQAELDDLLERAGDVVQFDGRWVFVAKEAADAIRKRMAEPKLAAARLTEWDRLRAMLTGRLGSTRVEATPEIRRAFDRAVKAKKVSPPEGLQAEMRPYQKRGFEWLVNNLRLGLGALIADDMGLGKTLQVIAALQHLKDIGELADAPVLVIAPTSVLINWAREIEKFAPGLKTCVYHGANRQFPTKADGVDVVITSYGLFRREAETLGHHPWRLMVLDEAQSLKNHTTEVAEAARIFPVRQVIGMTGTPVENRLLDYWSILSIVQPGLLGARTTFEREYAWPIQAGGEGARIAAETFRRLTAPFIIRRLKTDPAIQKDLPEKSIIDRFTTLTPDQAALYAQCLKSGLTDIRQSGTEGDAVRRRGEILTLITRLKQVTDSPSLVTLTEPKEPDSEKGRCLMELLEECRSAGNKTLVFTQYAQMGERLKTWIEKAGFGKNIPFIHGQVPTAQRQEMIDRFQEDADCPVMVLTLRSAGVGLNLTAANVVVHYDLWWNPAVEEQATDRAFRIGQQKDVLVYRFISAGTFEERINAMLTTKRKLAESTVNTGERWIGDMTDQELEEIFRLEE